MNIDKNFVSFTDDAKPLSIESLSSPYLLKEAKLVAYDSTWDEVIEWGNEEPEIGKELIITVYSPFCCRVGDTFSATSNSDRTVFFTARLLRIISMDSYSATLSVVVIGKGNYMSFLQPLSEKEISRIVKNYEYDYKDFISNNSYAIVYNIDEHSFGSFTSEFGQGDVCYGYVFYTDNNGIDHLVQESCNYYGEEIYVSFGDKVIGLHKNCPIKEDENGFKVNSKTKTLLGFSRETTDVVIPDGIKEIGYKVFWSKPDLRSVFIPDSVPNYELSSLSRPLFCDCPHLKYVYISRNRKIENEEVSNLLRHCPGAAIKRAPENMNDGD